MVLAALCVAFVDAGATASRMQILPSLQRMRTATRRPIKTALALAPIDIVERIHPTIIAVVLVLRDEAGKARRSSSVYYCKSQSVEAAARSDFEAEGLGPPAS